mmetsp:Transcript_30492/g.40284  ORF Transcript_30492/g.40284 Transcript_30492/m.40284 type:complete len:292 (+) Transcript_30492:55-930(+)
MKPVFLFVVLACNFLNASAFSTHFSPVSLLSSIPKSHGTLSMQAVAPGTAETVLNSLLGKIQASEELRPNSHPDNMGAGTWDSPTHSGRVFGFNGKKADYVSVFTTAKKDGSETTYNIEGWVMPMYDVPHLKISVSQCAESLDLYMDYIAKEDIAYSKEYLEQYYTGDVVNWWNTVMAGGVTENPSKLDIFARVLESPLKISVKLDGSSQSLALLQSSTDEFVSRWLSWLNAAQEIPRVRRGTVFSRDNTLRRINWQVLAGEMGPIAGENAKSLAAAQSGPGNEQYVGQAS